MSNNQSKIDVLIRLIAARPEKLQYYRQIFSKPSQAIKDFNIRPYAGEVIDDLVDIILSDEVVYNRIRTILTRKKSKKSGIHEDAMKSLIEKSVDRDVPIEVLVEVYNRGLYEEGKEIDAEQNAFNRVNSFLAGGKALDMDRDLLDQWYKEESEVEVNEAAKKKKYNPLLHTVNRILKNSISNPDRGKPKK